MPTVTVDVNRWIVASYDTEVMVTNSRASQATRAVASGEDSVANQSLHWTLRRFQDRFGTSWVAGRVTLSSETIQFYPREIADETPSPTPIAVLVDEVADISIESRLFHRAVHVSLSSGQTLSFRCGRAPEVFAEQLRTVVGAARTMSA